MIRNNNILCERNKDFVSHLLQVIPDIILVGLFSEVGLHLGVRVIDDSKEHVEKDEEDKEDVEDEVCWSKNTVGLLQTLEVEVAQDDTEQGETNAQLTTATHHCSAKKQLFCCYSNYLPVCHRNLNRVYLNEWITKSIQLLVVVNCPSPTLHSTRSTISQV